MGIAIRFCKGFLELFFSRGWKSGGRRGSRVGFQEHLVGFGAAFADGGDADGGMACHGAFVFTDAAADAQIGLDVGLFEGDGVAIAVGLGDGAVPDGLG